MTLEEGRVVTTKSDFTEDEWARVVRAPLVDGLALSLADPGGPIEAAKESMATLKIATNPPSREQLLAKVALEVQAMTQQRHNPLTGYKPTADGPPGDQVLQELRAVQAMVATKSTPDEAAAFRRPCWTRCGRPSPPELRRLATRRPPVMSPQLSGEVRPRARWGLRVPDLGLTAQPV